MVNPVHKGKAGEKEFCKWLQKNLGLEYEPERNYNQSSSGSADIISVDGWCFEVKRRETLDLDSWWWQVAVASKKKDRRGRNLGEPVVAFRQNRKPWEFLVSAAAIGLETGYIRMKEDVFIRYAKLAMKGHYAVGENLTFEVHL